MARGDGWDPLYQTIGERIVRARSAASLSQSKLAKKVGVSRTSIVNIESGRQRAPLHLLWQIAEALEVEAADVLPTRAHLASGPSPLQLDARTVALIEDAADNDAATKRQLITFIQKAQAKMIPEDRDVT